MRACAGTALLLASAILKARSGGGSESKPLLHWQKIFSSDHFGGNEMKQYIAHFVGANGHVTQQIVLLCADDADAHQRATELATVDTVELWQRDRLIATFVPCNRTQLH
jgi:hypothetical protein